MKHGTKSGYNQGCRKECCRAANRAYMAEYRLTHVRKRRPPTEAQREKAKAARALKRAGLPQDWTW